MQTRTIWIGVSLLATAGIAWALLGRDATAPGRGPATGANAPEDGTGTTPLPRRRPKIRIAGEVVDEAGVPVKGATVYVLDKKRPGADRDKIDHEVSDASGRWQLRTRTTVGMWIGAVARGYRTALLDGDGVDASKKIVHVLERSPALTVTVVDGAGEPVGQAGVQLSPWPPGGTYFCPGPLCRQGEQWAVTDVQGRCTFRQDVAAPVLVRAVLDGFHAEPGAAWMPDCTGETRITVRPNASFHLTLATQGKPPAPAGRLVTLEFLDPETGDLRAAFTETLRDDGSVRLERALMPGTYHVAVAVPGSPAVLVHGVVVGAAGDGPTRAQAEVPPPAGAALGRLVVRLEGNTATRRIKGRRRAPLSFLLRTDGPWRTIGWQPGAPERFDASRQRLEFELRPGTYRLLVADVLTGRAAQEGAVVVKGGEDAELTLTMALGQYGALPAAETDGVYVRRLEARDSDGALPLFGSSRDGRQRFSRGIDLIARKVRGEDVVIGPYPLDEFELVLHHSDGSKKTATYR